MRKMNLMPEGWEEIPASEETKIRAVWASQFRSGAAVRLPTPSWTWSGEALAQHVQKPELVIEFADKLLTALRGCTPPGEQLWVIEWQHAWYRLDPHRARGGWPYSVLPNGDACHILAPDGRFGLTSGWRQTGPVTLFGEDLLRAFEANPPLRFLDTCGPGERRRIQP